ncbi:PAS domain S-box protein [Noviherbaspirillum autotrophicum]|uniref:PAS domain S-box protein n=1 Tax=Noviherbaspirillum autotrophicum TaxID=709839 RepID=UPI0006947AF6|nr:PAS domain S-box protein [Noviherbaspirillum autotrophicum]
MNNLIALSADYYWEQDPECRFTRLQGTGAHSIIAADDLSQALGKAPWDIAGIVPQDAAWTALKEIVARRDMFRDVEWLWSAGAAGTRYLSVAGEPIFDGEGRFAGYRGIMRDMTAQKSSEAALRRFRAAMDASGDPIFLIDRETMRIIDANDIACHASGYSRDELLTLGPPDFLLSDRAEIERDFDAVIASGQGMTSECSARDKAGNIYVFELQRRAIRFGERWVIVTIGRDITRRKRAEEAAVQLGQMYAAISGTNEAILHARNPEELFQRVCEVAVHSGQIVTASVLLPDPQSEWVRVAAVAGSGAETLRSLHISFDESKPEGRGVAGPAFRTQKACIINDFLNDERVRPWRAAAGKEHAASCAALPLIRGGQSVGVLLLYSRETYAFDDEIVQLLERMARNIVFALDNFEREVERQKALEALRASEEKYRSILENMDDGYFEIDLAGTYMVVNDALCRLHGCSKDEALGMNYRDYMDADTAQTVFRVFNEVFRTGQSGELAEYPVWRQDGTRCVAQTSVQLIVDARGTPTGFRGISRDITARSRAQEALRASEEKYRSILENIEEAYYEVDISGCLQMCNEAFCRMFGYTMTEVIGLNYRQYHSPDESMYVFANFNEVFRTGITKKGIDWRLLHKNGDMVMCEGSIHLVRNACGEPVGFRGFLRDVTARREMEAALRESEERFRDLTELSSDWYWEQDSDFRFMQINGDVLGKTGMAAYDYLGRTLWEMPFEKVPAEQWIEHKARLAEGKPFYELVLKAAGADGALRYVSISGLPMLDGDGRLIGYRGTGKDITERKVAEERIRHLASHDILTSLPNRMMFNQMLSHQVQQARRYGRRFAVMFIDLDHFKAVNDNFGHEAGDMLLKETAKRLADSVRASDFVARLGGDEFVVIIQEMSDIGQLRCIAQKVVAAVRAPLLLAGTTHHVTASVGICVFPDHGLDEDALLNHADAAMYEVKHSTKNAFQFYLPHDS